MVSSIQAIIQAFSFHTGASLLSLRPPGEPVSSDTLRIRAELNVSPGPYGRTQSVFLFVFFCFFFFPQWPRDVMEGSMQAVKLTESVINDIAEDEE